TQQVAKFGFELIILKRANVVREADGTVKNPIKDNAEMLMAGGVIGGMSPLEKMKKTNPVAFRKRLFEANIEYQPQLEAAFAEHRPDLIVIDHFILPTALKQSGVPYVHVHSDNPLSLYESETLPPAGGG